MAFKTPIGIAMGVVGLAGIWYLEGFDKGLLALQLVTWTGVRNYLLSCIPLFVLMGIAVTASGIVRDLFDTSYKWFRHVPGGLGISTEIATAGFGALSGHSIVTAATMATIAYPEMKRLNYDKRLATGCIMAGGTIAGLIPPSIPLVLIGLVTEESIGRLLLAGFLPGILMTTSYILMTFLLAKLFRGWAPTGPPYPWKERLASVKKVWAVLVLFLIVVGGIYLGIFTPTEAASVGAFGGILFVVFKKGLNWKVMSAVLRDSMVITCSILILIVGIFILNHFFVLTRLPANLGEWVAGLGLSKYWLLLIISMLFIVLGCFIEPLAIWLLVVPVMYPIIIAAGFNGIWFGVIAVILAEMGLTTPPVGMICFVVKGVVKDVTMKDIFTGMFPFLIADLVTLTLIIGFPQIVLFIPNMMKG